eukprot:75506-Amphidinium_carterae.1
MTMQNKKTSLTTTPAMVLPQERQRASRNDQLKDKEKPTITTTSSDNYELLQRALSAEAAC